MSKMSVTIDGREYLVDSEPAIRTRAFRLADDRVYAGIGRFDTDPRRFRRIEPTTIEKIWETLPILKIDTDRCAVPRFLLAHGGRKYEAMMIPWSFARTPDTGKVLYVRWREDHANWYAPLEVNEIADARQLLELLPLATEA